MKTKYTIISIMMLLAAVTVRAQQSSSESDQPKFPINIGGSVYGGGNAGNLSGSTKVSVYGGLLNNVYGGARMANVGGRTFVNIDGKNANDDIIIVSVYGGNDISGTIGQGSSSTTVPDELENTTTDANNTNKEKNFIDNTWKTFVRTSASSKREITVDGNKVTGDSKMLTIGSLFGGGNGDYTYGTKTTGEGESATTTYIAKVGETEVAESATELKAPEISKTYLEIKGGCIAHVYGGGNNATVTEATTINIDNESSDLVSMGTVYAVTHQKDANALLGMLRAKMALTTFQSNLSSWAFNHARVFGGNNKADMSIIPKWNVQKGIIRDLFSGGNEGRMTSEYGLVLDIDPAAENNDKLFISNVYGGCRRADVRPMKMVNGVMTDVTAYVPEGYGLRVPAGLAARTMVRGGQITNVYGGNDISGKVYGGNAVGIYTSILGDVYGGGNGSYAYTDNANLATLDEYKDFYYNPSGNSIEALNAFRPNAEQVSIRLYGGEDSNNPIVIKGSIFVGGNSATLKKKDGVTSPRVELKVGSNVIANNVFLGNNGANMIKYQNDNDVLKIYKQSVDANGQLSDTPREGWAFNSLDLTDDDTFAQYMQGCALDLMPSVLFDNTEKGDHADYIPYSTYIGSFYCGGNVGSMTSAGKTTIDFAHKVVIFDKLVGGCNSAIVKAVDGYNARYEGGLIGANTDPTRNKLVLNLSGLKIQPKRWKETPDLSATLPDNYLMWNTIDSRNYDVETKTYPEMEPVTSGSLGNSSPDDLARRLFGGNIYGGCCESGIVNGNVVINLNETIIERDKLFDVVESGELGEENSLYGASQTGTTTYNITKRNTGVILGQQGMDVFGQALNVFGGGKGKDTEIWGSTTVNLNKGYTFQIFGGSEEGTIGKPTGASTASDLVYDDANGTYTFNGKTFEYDPAYSCYVNLCGTIPGVSKSESNQNDNMADCEFMYGGGFFGPICGNTVINLGAGRIFNSFAGSCNADILGHTETYIGRQVKNANKARMGMLGSTVVGTASNGDKTYVLDNDTCYQAGFTWIRDITYGANDLGGRIFGSKDFTNRVRKASDPYGANVLGIVHKYNATTNPNPDVLKAGAYTEYLQGRADAIFGGCYGTYNYSDPKFKRYTYTTDSSDDTPPSGTDLGDTKLDSNNNPLFYKPRVHNAFVNFRPTYSHTNNVVKKVYGAGQGQSGEKERDMLQDCSYVLIDIPQIAGTTGTTESANFNKYGEMEVFGAGAWGGVGMKYSYAESTADGFNLDQASAIIDLVRGDIGAAYGGSYEEGFTRRTVVNVPAASTINIKNIFGGAYGTQILPPCDVYEAQVNYKNTSENARVTGAIYGGNNNERRSLYTQVNINSPVWSDKTNGYLAKVYGAGRGIDTWAEHTEVNLLSGAKVYEVYGGGEMGHVLNAESVQKYMQLYKDSPSPQIANQDPTWSNDQYWNHNDEGEKTTFITTNKDAWQADWKKAWTIGNDYFTPTDFTTDYVGNTKTNLSRISDRPELDAKTTAQLHDKTKFNANVIINEGATVVNYAYGGGYGDTKVPLSGDVYGTTYITLLGGTVVKDIYAAGTAGSVCDLFGVGTTVFKACANAFIKGGTVRNVYGGGWRGSVGHHAGHISAVANNAYDIDGHAHVVIGTSDGGTHTDGIPSITRNVYGGGEGGAIYGDAYVTINKGYIGYRYNGTLEDDATTALDDRYVPELDDEKAGDNQLELGGNIFGGGYVANSYVDRTHVNMWDGIVRGSLYGGGEIGPVGRGTVHADSIAVHPSSKMHNYGFEGCQPAAIYKGGETHVYLWGGHVMRDVFGGGRGYDNWNGEGYMTDAEKLVMDRSSKGYVFGSTDVHIRGGEIGTEAGVLQGYGNVFGGGNEGFVYSSTGIKTGDQESDDQLVNGVPSTGGGFYYKGGNTSNGLTLDCNIAIEPYCKVTAADGISGFTANTDTGVKTSYAKGEYVPVEALNQLQNRNKDQGSEQSPGPKKWDKLDTSGITIHNALFAGGNITEGSDNLYANTVTVYGNTAASLRDIYNYDLISLGTDDMGGLYGDGNLTLVDGFRELHIDNYGTDYYSLKDALELPEYNKLSKRQKAYYKLKYVTAETHTFEYWECQELHTYETGGTSTSYKRGQKVDQATYDDFSATEKDHWQKGKKAFQANDQIEESEYTLMYGDEHSGEKGKWTLYGVTNIYDGRPLNTIQRADMCGVFGSRMVLKGAEDRTINTVDYHSYTINRVDEVSLNKRTSQAGDTDAKDAVHGNYFGIFNEVNYLGNLTSDVFFDNVRQTDSNIEGNKADGTTTYYQWKAAKPQAKNRNNGTSHNKVALASGVYLEIKRQEGELTGIDDWGYITGIVELDLINVMPGMGGGYVYARNEHGTKGYHEDWGKVTLLDYNNDARTYRHFDYTAKTATESLQPIETSGNFVHNTKQIVDDCYPNGGVYKDGYVKSPAHYWFIRGSIYVYDQYISAYTGSANAYAEKVEMPLTISAASNGRMTLREVQPNYYAYYDKNGNKLGDKSANADDEIIINNTTYKLNDPVSYWSYRLMSDAEKARFVKETYVVIDSCKVDGNLYVKGAVMLPSEYTTLKNSLSSGSHTVQYQEGDEWMSDEDHGFDYFFRPSNNLSHDKGYVLTYDVNNPMVWNKYYTKIAAPAQANKLDTELYGSGKDHANNTITQTDYIAGPTFTPKSGITSVFGQETKKVGDIISKTAKTAYDTGVKSHVGTDGQATVEEPAYIVTKEYSVKNSDGTEKEHLNPGTPIYKSKYDDDQWSALTGGTKPVAVPAKVCTTLLDFSATDYIYAGKLMTAAEIADLKSKVITKNKYTDDPEGTPNRKTKEQKAEAFLATCFDDAYYCTKEGLYGGSYFETGKAYSALESWCSMTAEERQNFVFNYDAFDVLIDPTYDNRLEANYGYKPQYDGYAPESSEETVEAGTALPQYEGSSPLNPTIYSKTQPIDYTAECTAEQKYYDTDGTTEKTIPVSTSEASWLKRTVYEAIPNDRHFFSPITVTKPGTYYVVNTVCMEGDVPFTVGQVIDEATYNSMSNKDNVTTYTFTEEQTRQKLDDNQQPVYDADNNPVYDAIYYFYCREDFTIGEKGGYAATKFKNGSDALTVETMPVKVDGSATATTSSSYNIGDEAKKGDVISQGDYDKLCNYQQGFIIHGVSPTETSTLYVSNESDIHDLSKEKIITVIYLYEYEESDESGLNVVPVSERHIVNIHIDFKSGVPEIGKITKPDVVLPGTTIGMNIPSVSQGAYRVTESGWELFQNETDARTHANGTPYINNTTPVYWYQNDYYIAYYAQTYLGKTYSNSVPISVANFHDLKKVMDDKLHHYYIDHKDVDYEPKIYINDYSSTGGNGLDLFKNLIDLTYVESKDNDGNAVAITTAGPLKDHMPLDLSNTSIPGGGYFEFFLNADQSVSSGSPAWTPIANNEGECFSGTLHGDGHTISGLGSSLFNHLCGSVYNLGVTGSFTSAGVADTGDGYVENCWINTSATSGFDAGTKAVFGNPKATGEKIKQIVNCYYQEGKGYNTTESEHGLAIPKPDKAFYNGEVAYDLNGFYLWKRYCDNNSITASDARKYQYYTVGSDNSLTLQPAKYYDNDPALCSSGYTPSSPAADYVSPKYVEDRFKDGDFIYVGDGLGTIPTTPNERLYIDPVTKEEVGYYPIWPDDYIFFGQALNYSHMDGKNGRALRTHQPLPSVINKSDNRVLTTDKGNRVYRAPAYFRSSVMGVAHFNPYAVFAAKEKLTAEEIADNKTAREAYPDMTAIDFTGYQEAHEANGANGAYGKGYVAASGSLPQRFFPPLLDDGGVKEFFNADLTQNLLAYTMTTTPAATQTNEAVSAYMTDVAYSETNDKYRTVDAWSGNIGGHWVQKQESRYVATRDHMLVDRHDFNAPIAYSFASNNRMWYQRMPENYVGQKTVGEATVLDSQSGWEGVSLPFKADIVTTDVKGEITHFYGGSWKSKNNTHSKIGHEYWLREFTGITVPDGSPVGTATATMNYPAANSADGDKECSNTFLWDFYYSYNGYQDLNKDKYQEYDNVHDYYKTSRTHEKYPRLAAGTPYIIGFPGERYYEFDLSGAFEATTALETPKIDGEIIPAQTITFASATGTAINVSDDEMTGVTEEGYTFKPNYLNKVLESVKESEVTTKAKSYALNGDGNAYVAVTRANDAAEGTGNVSVTAFRPYFESKPSASREATRSIVFSGDEANMAHEANDVDDPGTISAHAGKHKIIVTSTLKFTTDVRIVNTAGQVMATFPIKSGETIETRINNAGVYIVQDEEGKFIKKLAVE